MLLLFIQAGNINVPSAHQHIFPDFPPDARIVGRFVASPAVVVFTGKIERHVLVECVGEHFVVDLAHDRRFCGLKAHSRGHGFRIVLSMCGTLIGQGPYRVKVFGQQGGIEVLAVVAKQIRVDVRRVTFVCVTNQSEVRGIYGRMAGVVDALCGGQSEDFSQPAVAVQVAQVENLDFTCEVFVLFPHAVFDGLCHNTAEVVLAND